MRTSLYVLATLVLTAFPASAQTTGLQDPLLDRMIGEWVLEGTIAGNPATHDVVFEWVLDHHYVRFHEVARETDPARTPAQMIIRGSIFNILIAMRFFSNRLLNPEDKPQFRDAAQAAFATAMKRLNRNCASDLRDLGGGS